MKILLRAFWWSLGFEALLIGLAFGGYIGLGFLPYLALAFHFPALLLLQPWPSVRYGYVAPILVQWSIWFLMFAVFFLFAGRDHKREQNHATNLP